MKNAKNTKNTKPAKPAKKPAKPTKAAKPAKAKKGDAKGARRPKFEPAKLPAVFRSPDGKGELAITAEAITYAHGLHEVIFSPRSAHYFAADAETGNPNRPIIKAGSVGVRRGGQSLVFGPENPKIVAAVLTAAEAAKKGAEKRAKGGAK